MPALYTRRFLAVLALDVCGLLCIVAVYGYGSVLFLAITLVAIFLLSKATKTFIDSLDERQKRVRIYARALGTLVLVALVLRWALRLNNRVAWCVSSFAFIFMFSILYLEWLRLGEVGTKPVMANQLTDPTSPSVTPPAGAGGPPSVAADH